MLPDTLRRAHLTFLPMLVVLVVGGVVVICLYGRSDAPGASTTTIRGVQFLLYGIVSLIGHLLVLRGRVSGAWLLAATGLPAFYYLVKNPLDFLFAPEPVPFVINLLFGYAGLKHFGVIRSKGQSVP